MRCRHNASPIAPSNSAHMKFGKAVRLEANLQWNTRWVDYYLRYKTFKQLIHRLHDMSDGEIKKFQSVLFNGPKLQRRYSLVQTVLDSQKSGENADVVPVLHADEAPPIATVDDDAVKRDGSQFHSIQLNLKPTKDFRRRCFQEMYRREFFKVDNFCRKTLSDVRKRVAQVADQVNSRPNDNNAERRKALLRHTLFCRRFEQFVHINFTGLEKVVKKFDKSCRTLLQKGQEYEDLMVQVRPKVVKRRAAYLETIAEIKSQISHCMARCGTTTSVEEAEANAVDLDEFTFEDTVPVITAFNIDKFPAETTTRAKLLIHTDALGYPMTIPVIVAKGAFTGPVLGITSALHGNELNGIPLIFRLIRELELESMHGTVVAVPVLNCPGYLRHQRAFLDGQDLNRLFPGKPNGNCGQTYVYKLMEILISKFDYNVDLHTASFGRVNSLYVRADMNNRVTHTMAMLQESQIIVHNTAPDGSMRSAAMKLGIPSITVEIGDPSRIHRVGEQVSSASCSILMQRRGNVASGQRFVSAALLGVENIMAYLHMVKRDEEPSEDTKPVICSRSFWMFSQHGGLLTVIPEINTWVEEGHVIAQIRNVFGDVVATYRSPNDAIVVGKSVDPVCSSGDRILHLGIVESHFPDRVNDGHT